MKTAYFDCFAGVSGDMTLGALVDLGVRIDRLEQTVRDLGLEGVEIEATPDERASIGGTRVRVIAPGEQPHRHLADIERLIDAAALAPAVRARASAVFQRLAEAEAGVHRVPLEKVHLHEVGAVDAIVDVVGACVGLAELGVERVICSPVVLGRGSARGEHGPIPIPGPATLEILRGAPVLEGPVAAEMTTPTGAAIVRTLAESFGPLPAMTVERIGYGCGTRSHAELPNLLRIVVGDVPIVGEVQTETAVLLEANVDDLSPQIAGWVAGRLLEAGALDAWIAPVVMKKGRPGHVLSALATSDGASALAQLIFDETTTLGIREREVRRRVLGRRHDEVETPYGRVRVKVATAGERVLNGVPEFDDCAALARSSGVALKEIQAAALAAWRSRLLS